jgi:arabinose-5-phosphate isomerase
MWHNMRMMNKNHTPSHLLTLAEAVLRTEAEAVLALIQRLDDQFSHACEAMLACKGRVVVIGMGKSGHIGKKIAATLASTGTPAFFVHPGEANHGDMGMITPQDVVLTLSNSGTTDELLQLIPFLKRLHIPLIALTGNPRSPLAQAADFHLDVSVSQEACPLGLAPTASTTAALAMGDALAIALLDARGFTAEDFAFSHPAGSLGRRLLLKIDSLIHTGDRLPSVHPQAKISEALMEMTSKGLGMTAVIDENHRVLGVFTDGDLRRALSKNIDVHAGLVQDHMTQPCETVPLGLLAADALHLMETKKINGLLVTNTEQQLIGALNMHDLLRARVI